MTQTKTPTLAELIGPLAGLVETLIDVAEDQTEQTDPAANQAATCCHSTHSPEDEKQRQLEYTRQSCIDAALRLNTPVSVEKLVAAAATIEEYIVYGKGREDTLQA